MGKKKVLLDSPVERSAETVPWHVCPFLQRILVPVRDDYPCDLCCEEVRNRRADAVRTGRNETPLPFS
jgi:hypothetical protein